MLISDERIKEMAKKSDAMVDIDTVEGALLFARAIEAAARAEALEDVRREYLKARTWQDLSDFIARELMEAK